jgi:hypothetical protein
MWWVQAAAALAASRSPLRRPHRVEVAAEALRAARPCRIEVATEVAHRVRRAQPRGRRPSRPSSPLWLRPSRPSLPPWLPPIKVVPASVAATHRGRPHLCVCYPSRTPPEHGAGRRPCRDRARRLGMTM